MRRLCGGRRNKTIADVAVDRRLDCSGAGVSGTTDGHLRLIPPSTSRTWPVTYLERTSPRMVSATSSALPARRSGALASTKAWAVAPVCRPRGVDQARCDRIHSYLGRDDVRQQPSHVAECRLGRRIRDRASCGSFARRRRHVDHATVAGRAQVGHGGDRHLPCADHVDVEDPAPHFGRRGVEVVVRYEHGRARVVHEHVEASQALDHLLDQPGRSLRVRHVRLHVDGPRELRGELGAFVDRFARVDRHERTRGSKAPGRWRRRCRSKSR